MIYFFVLSIVLYSSLVVSLTCTFRSVLNKAYKSATQRKLHSYSTVWGQKKVTKKLKEGFPKKEAR